MNLLPNGGFEDVADGMPTEWQLFSPDSAPHIASSQQHVRSGEWSVQLDDPGASQTAGLRSALVEVDAGQTYEASVFIYSDSGEPSLYLEFWDSQENRISSQFHISRLVGSWQRVDLRGTAPQDATHASLLVYSSASNVGTSYFDDAAIHEVTALGVERFGPAMLTAAVRGAVVLDDSVFISSRFNTPDERLRLGEFDVSSGAERAVIDLDIDSSGGHALATDGRYIYVGPAGNEHIWRFDPLTQEARAWAHAGSANTWYYDMRVDGDHLYISTYPDCMVKRVSLSDASVDTYGRVSDSLYATAVAVDEEYVYGGSASPGRLLRWPKEGGEPFDLSPHLSESPVGILGLAFSAGHLYVASGRQLISVRSDGSERVVREVSAEDRYIDQLSVAADGTVYALARMTTNHYRVTPTGLENVGQPADNMENQMLQAMPDGHLVGVSGLGHIWNLQPEGGAEVWHTATRGFGYPEVAQSMFLGSDGQVWVGGHYAMTVHHPSTGESWRFDVDGEPKALAEGPNGTIYAGLYPSGTIAAIEPDSREITVLGTLGNAQMRTRALHTDPDRGQLLVASGPSGGLHTGALTFVDLESGEFDVRRDYLPEQAVMAIAVDGTTAYIVGDTYGESTPGPIRSAAQVAAVDLDTRELLWREELRSEWLSYEDVMVSDGVLYLMGRRPQGLWFAYDLAAREVVMEGDLGGYGAFGSAEGRVFTWVHWADEIRELPSGRSEDGRLLHHEVPGGWYNNPEFNLTRGGMNTWGMHGTDLALFELGAELPPLEIDEVRDLVEDASEDGRLRNPLQSQMVNTLREAAQHQENGRATRAGQSIQRALDRLRAEQHADAIDPSLREELIEHLEELI
ncbi:FIMAH domain-containing protein [Pseudactinotalea sp. Z1739]|uniref:FIMAH domain-containing protein n=1 Tax=Pseudactinotalea sp. Z1739 TaxID=3413028 RepID=UPI003C7A1829